LSGLRGTVMTCVVSHLVQVLDDFRFKARMPSRTAVVRELLKRGLSAEGFGVAQFGSKSEDFGVVGKMPAGRGK
jgi:hypothetical protein